MTIGSFQTFDKNGSITNTFSQTGSTTTQSTSHPSNISLEKLAETEPVSSAFYIDINNLKERINSVTNAFDVANQGVAFSQYTNLALYHQNEMLTDVKSKLLHAKESSTTDTGRELIREEVVDTLNKFDSLASDANYKELYVLQNSDTNNSASLVYSFQVSEFPEITISSESIRSNSEGLGLTDLKNLGVNELTTDVANTQSGVVSSAITAINEFQDQYKVLQSQIQSSVSALNNYQQMLKKEENSLKIDFAKESSSFEKTKISTITGSLTASQANAMSSTVLNLLSISSSFSNSISANNVYSAS